MSEQQVNANEQGTNAAPSQEPKAGKAKKPAPKMRTILKMAKGKARVTKKGIVSHGDELTAQHFKGGQKRLDELKESGVVVEHKVPAE